MLNSFLTTSLDELLAVRAGCESSSHAFGLFRRAACDVPAYRTFLAQHGVSLDAIRSAADLGRVPLMNKTNYMQAYPLPQRCWDGRLESCERVAVSSGSTGVPTFWPRSARHEAETAFRFEQVFRDGFHAHRRSTLAVVCFALGNWVGGIYTASCLWLLARKGYPLTVATPGNNRSEIVRVVRELAPHFEQTVLLGYPPFVKDAIDAGFREGIEWNRHRVRLVFAGEVFSEEWRARVLDCVGSDAICFDSASLYGTADGGVLGNETPISIAIRRFFASRPDAARELFGESRLPTLVQYDPVSRYFERHDGTLVVSADCGVPLIRYHIADQGGLVSYTEMRSFLADWGACSPADLGLDESAPVRELPFVYVFGRADFTVSYYGANIYPENVTVGLERPDLAARLTGKFVLEAPETEDGGKILRLTVELAPGVAEEQVMASAIADAVKRELLRLNSEFAHYTPADKQLPVVILRTFADPVCFPAGVKHRYTRR